MQAIWRRSSSILKSTEFGELFKSVNVATAAVFCSSLVTDHKDKFLSIFDALRIKCLPSYSKDLSVMTLVEWPVNVCNNCEFFHTLMLLEAVTISSPLLIKQIAVGLSGPQSKDDSC